MRDVREGKVSAERAREIYRVEIDSGGGLDGRDRRAPGSVVIDPITFEVIRNALVAATDEMVLALKRSAYSTNIKTRSDFSCAFFDAELRCVAQGFAQPVHLGSMVEQVPRAVRDYGAENLGPGDAIITNDPYPSGVHLNDVSLISPVHCDGELLGYVANLAHHVDVGGGAPGEHRRVPRGLPGRRDHPAGQARRGGPDRPRRLPALLAQIRSKHETAGDLRAQVAANATGVRRVQALVERLGRDDDRRRRWTSCSTTPSAARAPSSPRSRTASTRPRASSTTTATPTSPCG